jgi:mercuric ion transport protein
VATRPRSLKGSLLLGVAVLTCPCHLPILMAVLAGTGLAGLLSEYAGLALLALSLLFVVSLGLGLRTIGGGVDDER